LNKRPQSTTDTDTLTHIHPLNHTHTHTHTLTHWMGGKLGGWIACDVNADNKKCGISEKAVTAHQKNISRKYKNHIKTLRNCKVGKKKKIKSTNKERRVKSEW